MFDDGDKKALMAKSLEAQMKKAEVQSENLPDDPIDRIEAEVDEDYLLARQTYKELMITGTKAIDSLSEIAKETEHPRAFEVLSKAITDVGNVADKLMKLQKEKAAVKGEKVQARAVTNNNVFVGSTSDLQRMLLDAKKQEKEEAESGIVIDQDKDD
tara:strand:- start:198 stop:668 length:471 start_codon:yes stop_codon:yes gene_type:complete